MADGQIADNRAGGCAGSGRLFRPAGNRVGYAAADRHNRGVAAGFRRNGKGVVAGVAIITRYCAAVNRDRAGTIDPKRKAAGNSAGTIAASHNTVIAVPSNEHRVAGGNADGVRQIIVEHIGIEFTQL